MTDIHKFVLAPLDRAHTEDSTPITADCGHECWIAPNTREVVENRLIRTATVCDRCVDVGELAAAFLAQNGLLALPGTRENVAEVIGAEATDRFWDRFRVHEHTPQPDAEEQP